ncbi:MAG: hypothetical protein WDZ83_14570 [Rhizobiaceae bacterium]
MTVRCMNCFVTRHYLPADLKTVLGNVDCDDLDGYMKCERCGKGDCIRAEPVSLSAQERQRNRVRRLVRIKWKKVPEWREE